jgi:hypothetical protein
MNLDINQPTDTTCRIWGRLLLRRAAAVVPIVASKAFTQTLPIAHGGADPERLQAMAACGMGRAKQKAGRNFSVPGGIGSKPWLTSHRSQASWSS